MATKEPKKLAKTSTKAPKKEPKAEAPKRATKRETPPAESAQKTTSSWSGGQIELIPLDQITALPGFSNVRGDLGTLDELREDIATRGIRRPLHVIRNATTGSLWLADGFRRMACLQELAKTDDRFSTAPCLVQAGSERDVAFANLSADNGHAEIPAFRIAYRLWELSEAGSTYEEIAAATGKPHNTVKGTIHVVRQLCPKAREAGLQGSVSLQVARKIHGLDEAGQLKAIGLYVKTQTAAAEAGASALVAQRAAAKAVKASTQRPALHVVQPGEQAPPQKQGPEEPSLIDIAQRTADLRKRWEKWARMFSEDVNAWAAAVAALDVDTSSITPRHAYAFGLLDGLAVSVQAVHGDLCPTCGAPQVVIPDDPKLLPNLHECPVSAAK